MILNLRRDETVWEEVNSTVIHRSVSAHEHTFALVQPGQYFARVCGIAVTQLAACADSDGIQYDTTPPTRGELCIQSSGTGSSAGWCSNHSSESASDAAMAYLTNGQLPTTHLRWSDFSEPESMVASYRWAVGSTAGSHNVIVWQQVGLARSVVLGTTLPIGLYFFTLICTNNVGLETNVTLPVLVVEHRVRLDASMVQPCTYWTAELAPPSRAIYRLESSTASSEDSRPVCNASAPHILVRTTLIANKAHLSKLTLEIIDTHASIESSRTAIFSSTSLPLLEDEDQKISLTPSSIYTTYEAKLHATNLAGLTSSISVSFSVDPVPPDGGSIYPCDTTGGRVTIARENHSLRLCARDFLVPHSGLAYHRVTLSEKSTHLGVHWILHEEHLQPLTGLNLPCNSPLSISSEAVSGKSLVCEHPQCMDSKPHVSYSITSLAQVRASPGTDSTRASS